MIAEYSDTYTIVFIYDAAGSPIGMRYRSASFASEVWETYWYEKNLQGDIVAIYSNDGVKLISYIYDAWGSFTTTYHNGGASTTAAKNPFKYRGYYYDSDLGLYYLQSRYYDPVTGRFINADGYVSTGQGLIGHNMYAYCNNNPVMFVDPSGNIAGIGGVIAICVFGGTIIGFLASLFFNDMNDIEGGGDAIITDKTPNSSYEIFYLENDVGKIGDMTTNIDVGFGLYKEVGMESNARSMDYEVASIGTNVGVWGFGVYAKVGTATFNQKGTFNGFDFTMKIELGYGFGAGIDYGKEIGFTVGWGLLFSIKFVPDGG